MNVIREAVRERVVAVLDHEFAVKFDLDLRMAYAIYGNLLVNVSVTADIQCKVAAKAVNICQRRLCVALVHVLKLVCRFFKKEPCAFRVHVVALLVDPARV